jgi:hypothetical protein
LGFWGGHCNRNFAESQTGGAFEIHTFPMGMVVTASEQEGPRCPTERPARLAVFLAASPTVHYA